MRLLVCLKQVPDPEAPFELDEATGGLRLHPSAAYRISRYDEIAVEEAVRLKETLPGTEIDVATVGPERAAEALRRAMGMGADRGIHLLGETEEDGAAPVVAGRLAGFAAERAYDLILCGVLSEDLMQGQVGPMLAANLDWPCATAVVLLKLAPGSTGVEIEREIEGGARERLAIGLPAVLTLQSGINRPRYPTLSNLLRANRQALEVHAAPRDPGAAATGLSWRFARPQRSRSGVVLAGERREKAERLAALLRQRALLRG